jgi:hypothetical protein
MINGTNGVGAATGINYTGALTPDALMLYCASRLKGLDQQMQEQFAKQQTYRAASGAVNKLQARFAELSANQKGISPSDPQHKAIFDEMESLWNDAMAALPPDSPQRAQLQGQRDAYNRSMMAPNGGDWAFSKEECASMATSIGTISKDLSSSAELDMIQLQSLMSQRQTAIQMCTNLVSALGETSKTIAQKIGA